MKLSTILFAGIVVVWILGGIMVLSEKFRRRESDEVPDPDNRILGEIDELLTEVFERCERCVRRQPPDRFGEEGCLDRDRIRMDIHMDVLHLFSYLAVEEGGTTRTVRSIMRGVLGYVPSEESIASMAESVKRSLSEQDFIFSPLCVHLVRLGCWEEAKSYLQTLTSIGRILLREMGREDSKALERFVVTAGNTLR